MDPFPQLGGRKWGSQNFQRQAASWTSPTTHRQVEALLNSKFRTDWRNPLCLGGEEDSIQLLNHAQQAVISWLRTEQCWLLAHLFRRGLPPTLECPCGTSAQTPEHFLQSGPNLDVLGSQTWPSAVGSMKSCGDQWQPFGRWQILCCRQG